MKWIKYKIVCNQEKNILLDKKLGYSDANLVIARREAYNGEYEIFEDDKEYEEKPLAIELGGTGARTKEEALESLGALSNFKPLVLKEGIHYGNTLPNPGTPGRIFFKVVDN